MNPTEAQLDILRHMLGINNPSRATLEPYRDYFCANPNDADLQALSTIGAVELYSQRDGYDWYKTTEAGRAAAIESARKRLPKRSQLRYSRFLDVKDCYRNLTFKEFITNQRWAEYR